MPIRRATPADIDDYLPYTVGETWEETRAAMTRKYATWVRDEEAFLQVAGLPEMRRVQLGPFYPEKGIGMERAQKIIQQGTAWFREDWGPEVDDWYTFTLVDSQATAIIFKGWLPPDATLELVGNDSAIVGLSTFAKFKESADAWHLSS